MPCKTLYRIDDLSDHGSDSGACHAPAKVLPGEADILQELPAGNYLCFQEPRKDHSDPLMIFPPKLLGQGAKVIISSMSPDTYKYDKVTLEFQVQT